MSLSNGSMVISGLDKNNNNLNALKGNSSITNLEIKQLTLKDNWTLLSELKQLRSLTVKDSYVDFKKFYSAICSLPKLERLTYNHYCFFNKSKKDKLPDNLKLSSLKIFKLEFPDESEPDFEINTYSHKSYANKNNSITEVKNSHQVFENLEEIQFVNYQIYKKRMEEDGVDKNKLNYSIYWNMDFKTLNQFKSLKRIKINDGEASSLLEVGMFELLFDKFPKGIKFTINGASNNLQSFPADFKVLNFSYHKEEDANIILNKINPDLQSEFKDIFENTKSLTINENNLYDVEYGEKPWKFKKNKINLKILDHKYDTITFSPAFAFLNNYTSDEIKKAQFFLNIISQQKNLNNVVFDLSKNEYYKDDDWESSHFILLTKFIYELLKQKPNIKIYLFYKNLKEIIKSKKTEDAKFRIHLIYLINFMIQYQKKIDNRIIFIGSDSEELKKFYEKFISEEIDQVVIVDDIFYNLSRRFGDKEVIYAHEISDLKIHFPHFHENLYEKKLKLPLQENYRELLRILSFDGDGFPLDDNKLLLLVKKNRIKNIQIKNVKKYFSYLGSSWHHLTHRMEANEKKWNAKKIVGALKIKTAEEIKKVGKKLYDAAIMSLDDFIQSDEIIHDEKTKENFLKPLLTIEFVKNSGIEAKQLNGLTHCWFEGVHPWQGTYVKLNQLDKLIPCKDLESLRLSDCLALDNLNIPHLPKLKFLHLNPYNNHHAKVMDVDARTQIRYFENLPNLEKLYIGGLYNWYNSLLSHTLGFTGYATNLHYSDKWRYIKVDLSSLHQLKKLKEIQFQGIKASDLDRIVSLPAVKKLSVNTYHVVKEDKPDLGDGEQEEVQVKDKNFRFLKNSNNLEDLTLTIGDLPHKDYMEGWIWSSYEGSGNFIDYISYKLKKLNLSVNLNIKNQSTIQDMINKICNRFLKLEELRLNFGIAVTDDCFDENKNEYKKKLIKQTLDVKKFSKLKNLKVLSVAPHGAENFINYNTKNFQEIIKLKKIKDLNWDFASIDFQELRKTRQLFKDEKYDDPAYYDYDYKYYVEEDEEYKKKWTRFTWINTDLWDDYYSLEDRYIALEQEENKKKYKKPEQVVRKKKN